ncbi:Hypothetical protein NTJ_12319 [Nesidiocoris tenuis]|uniref:Myosin motor domain-containing protein n=1 Tax=Nesidiocoris tenuis TaxID=355587 RepID=A0ABN7B9L5_9HEMI|nr:Hypothetical protein NTJ_12319 [Nesidiocoris tenuis]
MRLLMQNYYGHAWFSAKRKFISDVRAEALLESAFLSRRYIDRMKVFKVKQQATNAKTDEPRYVYPKFRNIPARVNSYRRKPPNVQS